MTTTTDSTDEEVSEVYYHYTQLKSKSLTKRLKDALKKVKDLEDENADLKERMTPEDGNTSQVSTQPPEPTVPSRSRGPEDHLTVSSQHSRSTTPGRTSKSQHVGVQTEGLGYISQMSPPATPTVGADVVIAIIMGASFTFGALFGIALICLRPPHNCHGGWSWSW